MRHRFTLEETGPRIDAFLDTILDLADLDLDFDIESGDGQFELETPDMVVKFSANDHRALRMEELRMSALAAAEKVRKTRAPFHFSPMNSRERRIIHLALREQTDVRSESVGMAPNRQVVVVPADMKELPAGAATVVAGSIVTAAVRADS